jgi:NAD(P)-dependent dehydrogenase (short-subunit alcohol dehydrogenase family)
MRWPAKDVQRAWPALAAPIESCFNSAVSGSDHAGQKRLADRRILVVGASSGIGHAIAIALGGEGARVALAARRKERLEEIAEAVPGGAAVARCDVRDPDSCEDAVAAAVGELGGLDALVYAAGKALLVPVAEADAEAWREIFETNVSGASLVTRAALPHLSASRGRALYLSSISADDRPPRRGLGLYVVSKAALNRLIAVWQEEQRSVGFTCLNVGDTGSTEMARGWDPEQGGECVREWIEKGFMFGRAMLPDSVAHHVVDLLASEETVSESTIVPRFPEGLTEAEKLWG